MIEVLGISIRVYGLMIGLGVLVGRWVSARVARREGIGPEVVWDGLVWVVVGGVIGARAYHVVDYWGYYSQHVWEMGRVWNGGLGILGGLVGGVAGMVMWLNGQMAKKELSKRLGLVKALDVASFGVPLGQAIGRWGNWFNQELYGRPTDLPWGIWISVGHRAEGLESFSRFHPLFLYESLLSVLLFGLMWWRYYDLNHSSRRGWRVGQGRFLGMYLVGYGVIRMVLEPMRIRVWEVGNVPVASIFSVIMVLLGSWLVVRKLIVRS